MIIFTIKSEEFSYDLKALSLCFYPEKECRVQVQEDWAEKSGYPLICEIDGEVCLREELPADYTKNSVKALVYHFFEKRTGIPLPWGILTGIRPSKIPLEMKIAGMDREEIVRTLREEYLVSKPKSNLAVDVAEKEYALTSGFDHENGYNIYIGIPFCPSICRYCSFSSYDIERFHSRVGDYLCALEREMKFVAERYRGMQLHTIYVGGGTPTSLDEKHLKQLMEMIHRHLPVGQTLEFTLEAGRPDSITEEKFRIMKEAGVTRISVNPQTMKQQTLDLIGRRHTVQQVKDAFRMAREAGFGNINMDLIVGLPEEDEVDFINTLYQIRELDPESVTLHTLVIKRASEMCRAQMEQGLGIRPEDMMIPLVQIQGGDFLRENGYEPYYMYRLKNKAGMTRNTNQENVAYAKPGKECLYNIFMMEELETVIAIGCGGSTKYVCPDQNRVERVENVKDVDNYIDRIDEMIARKEGKTIWH